MPADKQLIPQAPEPELNDAHPDFEGETPDDADDGLDDDDIPESAFTHTTGDES